jgi:hypothetical protein
MKPRQAWQNGGTIPYLGRKAFSDDFDLNFTSFKNRSAEKIQSLRTVQEVAENGRRREDCAYKDKRR